MVRHHIAAALLIFGSWTVCSGQGTPLNRKETVEPVAVVLKQKITADDLRPSKEEAALFDADLVKLDVKEAQKERKELREEMLRGWILSALGERYVKEHHLEADDAEIKNCLQFLNEMKDASRSVFNQRADEIRKRLAEKNLDDAERKNLTAELALLENRPPPESERRAMRAESEGLRRELKSENLNDAERRAIQQQITFNDRFQDLTDAQAEVEWKKMDEEIRRAMAIGMVEHWKLDRDLFKQFGGRIIFQQTGLEPIDAERAFLQERDKAGDFTIYDADLKEGFWHYWKRDHGSFTLKETTGHEFDEPPWSKGPPEK